MTSMTRTIHPMIRLEHANLVVKDIQPTLDFIQTAFPDWKIRGQGEMTWHGKPRHWLHVGDDDYYLTLNDDGEGEHRDLSGHTPGLAHLGFVVDDLDSVIERLEAKGFEIDIDGAEHPFRKNVYFLDPAGFQFEFVQYLSDLSSERNRYDSTATIKIDAEQAQSTEQILGLGRQTGSLKVVSTQMKLPVLAECVEEVL